MTIAAQPEATAAPASVGILGLGVMGTAMAIRLLAAGHQVTVYNRDRTKAERLAQLGATVGDTPAAVARAAPVVVSCLLDDTAVEAVHLGSSGVHEGIRPGHVIVEHATFSPALAQSIAAQFRRHGAEFLDAPITGGLEGAVAGTLTAMVGGDRQALERIRPVLSAYAGQVFHVGDTGSGLALKLCNQLLVTCHLAAAAEAAALIESLGLPARTCDQVLNSGWAASAMLARTLPRAARRDYASSGATVGGLIEVQRLVTSLGTQADVSLTTFEAAASLFSRGASAGWAAADPAILVALCHASGGAAESP